MKHCSIGEFAKLISKTEQLNHFLGIKGLETKIKKVIGYCRVSSHKLKR